jgi:hypothetical protein
MSPSVRIGLSEFALVALRGEERGVSSAQASARMARAVRYYLGAKDRERPGWRYPSFLREDEEEGGSVELELRIDDAVWRSFEAEAKKQGVSTTRLVEHAALYFVADLNAGRIEARILEGAETGEVPGMDPEESGS